MELSFTHKITKACVFFVCKASKCAEQLTQCRHETFLKNVVALYSSDIYVSLLTTISPHFPMLSIPLKGMHKGLSFLDTIIGT